MPAQRDPMPGADAETTRVQAIYDRFASRYDPVVAVVERLLFGGGRAWVCGQARGQVLEVAVGTGRNLPYYPDDVRLTGVDISPGMLDQARKAAGALNRPVDLRVGDAQRLPFPDASYDTVVATLAMCSIPDDHAAVAEMSRVLRPGGRLLLLDHVASPNPVVRFAQRALDPVLVRLEGDHLLRQPQTAVRATGLVVDHLVRARAGIVLGISAHKPVTH